MLPPRDETSNSNDTGGPSPRYGNCQNGTILETFAPVPLSALFVAQFGQHIRQALMRLRMAGVDAESSFIVLAGGRKLAAFVEHVAQVHVAHGIVGMARHGFRVGRARGGSISGGMQQRAQIVQRQPVRGLARQHVEIGVSALPESGPFRRADRRARIADSTRRARTRCGSRSRRADSRRTRCRLRPVRLRRWPGGWLPWRVPAPRSFPPAGRSRARRCGDSRWPREWPGARRGWWWTAPPAPDSCSSITILGLMRWASSAR